MLIVLTNATLDVTFTVGWWLIKKIASGAYSLGSYLFDKQSSPSIEYNPSEENNKRMIKWVGTHEKNMNNKDEDKPELKKMDRLLEY